MILQAAQSLEFNVATFVTLAVGIGVNRLVAHLQTLKVKKDLKVKDDNLATGVAQLHIKVDSIATKVTTMEQELQINGGSGTVKELVLKCATQTERMISQSSAMLEAGFNQSNIAQFLLDDRGDCTFANDAMVELFGMNRPHFLKRKLLKAVEDQKEREEINDRMDYAVKRNLTYSMIWNVINQRAEAANRIPFPVMVSFEKVSDTTGNFMWYQGKAVKV